MELPTNQTRARPTPTAVKPINEHALTAFEKSGGTIANHAVVKRIIKALRNSWAEIVDREDALWREQDERRRENEQRSKQAVLVVVHVDGWVEIYADPGTTVSTLELSIVDSEDECDWQKKLPHSVKHLLERTPIRTAFPKYVSRPNQLTDEALLKVQGLVTRIERDERISDWAKQAVERLKVTTP